LVELGSPDRTRGPLTVVELVERARFELGGSIRVTVDRMSGPSCPVRASEWLHRLAGHALDGAPDGAAGDDLPLRPAALRRRLDFIIDDEAPP